MTGSAPPPEAALIVGASHAMALRFHRGGTLFAFGDGAAAADAARLAVEFGRPVAVGGPALPAFSLNCDAAAPGGTSTAGPEDIVLGLSSDRRSPGLPHPLAAARERGSLTVALTGAESPGLVADHVLAVGSDDPRLVRETHVAVYRVLWELVHVFLEYFERSGTPEYGVPDGRAPGRND